MVYILKSILCLGVLWMAYYFWLSKEQLFKFNRFYLIAAVIFALTAPLITFETITYIDPIPVVESDFAMSTIATESNVPLVIETERAFNWSSLLLAVYLIIGTLLTVRFTIGLVKLGKNIKNNPSKKWYNASLILLFKPLVPHTFFNYIFINKTEYEQDQIEKELLLHEYEHVKQKHSIDILFIELIQLVFWFNPFIYLIKKSIKLNHEFLADQAVLNTNISIDRYQLLLLQIAGLSSPHYLSSSINYSITKKRLKMMSKTKNNAKRWVFTFLLLPLFTVLLYSFSSHKETLVERLPKSTMNTLEHNNIYARSITLQILDHGHYAIDGLKISKNNFANALQSLHTDLTKVERNKLINLHIKTTHKIPFDQLRSIQNVIAQYGYNRIVTPFQEIVRAKGNDPVRWDASEINTLEPKPLYARSIELKILSKDDIEVGGQKVSKNNLLKSLQRLHRDLSKVQRDEVINLHIKTDTKIAFDELKFIQKAMAQYGYHRIVTPFQEIVRAKGNEPIKWSLTQEKTRIQIDINRNNQLLVNQLEVTTVSKLSGFLANYNKHNGLSRLQPKQINATIIVDPMVKMGVITDVKQILLNYGVQEVILKERDAETGITYIKSKWLRIRINGKKIVINGKATTLEKFASSIDKLTANWTMAEMKGYKSDVQIQNVPDDFLKKLNVEYKKTKLYKAHPTGHGLIPPPHRHRQTIAK